MLILSLPVKADNETGGSDQGWDNDPSEVIGSGDINGDGKVNIKDMAILIKLLNLPASQTKTQEEQNCYSQSDLNADGKVNIQDVECLKAVLLQRAN